LQDIQRCETHAHSHFSNVRLLDSINRPKDLILTAAKIGLKGIALTDHEILSGHVEWLKLEESLKKEGKIPQDFKCLCGNEIYLTNTREKSQKYFHFILIAKDTIGHKQLRQLSSQSWYNSYFDRGMERVPTLKEELSKIIKSNKGHIIASTACLGGELANLVLKLIRLEQLGGLDTEKSIIETKTQISDFLNFCLDLFGEDFYIEIQPNKYSKEQIAFNRRIKDIAKAFNIKMIITTDAHYLTAKDRPIHKSYLNSKEGEREVDDFYATTHLMDNIEMFGNISSDFTEEEFKELCANTMEIYNKVEEYDLFHNSIIPEVKVKDYPKSLSYFGVNNSLKDELDNNWRTIKELLLSDNIQERYWINECLDSLMKREPWENLDLDSIDKENPIFKINRTKEEYISRIETEAEVIKTISNKLGNCLFAYFNTFQHYIDLFWKCGSIVGPGRGSAVGFLSNYLLGITQLDPVKWNLDYWRFLNKERIELPDIDIDLAPSKRKLIFKKIREERGELNVVQVATFGTEGTRSAILTACRGYRSQEFPSGIDVDIGQYMTSLIPAERGFLWSLNDVINGNEEKGRKPVKAFLQEVKKYDGLLDIMTSIEGLVCQRGQHASGVILYNESPWETSAIMRSPSGDLTTQFDLHMDECLGDVKYDFLVTEICDKIINCIELLQKDNEIPADLSLRAAYEKYLHPEVINLKDERVWKALSEGSVLDVFQFNSDVGLQAAKQIKPNNPIEMMMANSLMRLMGEKDKERPLDRYTRLKNNINEWYKEVKERGLSDKEISILEKYYLPRYGTPAMQEDLMLICMDKDIARFSLKEANDARKIVAKKQMSRIPELKEKFISQCPNKRFGEYVWETTMGPQMG